MSTPTANKSEIRSFLPLPRDALTVALMPPKALEGAEGRRCIETAMRGVEKHFVDELDGFGYTPTHTTHLDTSLMLLASGNGNVPLLKYWIEEKKANPNERNHSMSSALISAIAAGENEARDYLLGVDGIELGVPEAAALKLDDLLPRLVAEYDRKPPEEKLHGLSGAEIAFIFSGLSGDVDWVLSLMKDVEDVNVGAMCETGNVGYYAVRSGNVPLVRGLVKDKGVELQNLFTHDILFGALYYPEMMRFIVEELRVTSLDVVSEDTRNTLMDSALLNRCEATVKFLLEHASAEEWAQRSEGIPLSHSVFLWNTAEVSKFLLPSVSRGSVQPSLRQAVQLGDVEMVRILCERFGGDLSDSKENFATVLELAASSGSLDLVTYVLENAPDAAKFKHKNGYNFLVAAARTGSRDVFRALAKKFPDLLSSTVWNGMTLLMVACSDFANEVVSFLLEEDFYDSHGRGGKVLDANTTCGNGRTALSYAVRSGCVANAEALLSQQQRLALRELEDRSKVNELFVDACKSERFAEMIDCLERRGLSMNGAPSASLSMTAAENGTVFVAEPGQFMRLRSFDKTAGLILPDEILLCALIRNAPDWAVANGSLAVLVGAVFAAAGRLASVAALEQAMMRSDKRTALLFDLPKLLDGVSKAGAVLKTLKGSDISDSKNKVPHWQLSHRRHKFIAWLLGRMPGDRDVTDEEAHKVLSALIKADLNVDIVEPALGALAPRCPRDKLQSLLVLATAYCQFVNVKILTFACGGASELAKMTNDKGENLALVALSTKKVSDPRRQMRFPLLHWLVEDGGVSLASTNSDGATALMSSASLGNARITEWIGFTNCKKKDDKGKSLVSYAISGGHKQIVKKVMEICGSGVCGEKGETPLHIAAAEGNLSVLRFLVEVVKVDAKLRDSLHRSALDYCIFCNNPDARDYLELMLGKSEQGTIDASPRGQVQLWLKDISKAVGKNITLNTNGICAFTYEDYTIVIEVPDSVGSLFIYAAFAGEKFDVREDSWKMLLVSAMPGADPLLCPSLEPNTQVAKRKRQDVMLSVSQRVEDLDSQSFRNLLENFIDGVLVTGKRLSACAAKRYLSQVLIQASQAQEQNDTNNKASVANVVGAVSDFTIDPPKNPTFDSQDKAVFQRSLQAHMEEISRDVGKNISVNSNGMCAFAYENLTICIEPASAKTMCLWVTLWNPAKDGQISSSILKRCLEINYLQQETRGGVLALTSNAQGDDDLWYFYKDSVDVPPSDFRNILENFIDSSLTLYKRIRDSPEPLLQADHDLDKDLREKEGTILRELRLGDITILRRIFAQQDSARISNKIDSLALTVMGTRDMNLWRPVAKTMISMAQQNVPPDELGPLRQMLFRRSCEKVMLDDDLINVIMDGTPAAFELAVLKTVFSSKSLLQAGKAASTAVMIESIFRPRRVPDDDGRAPGLVIGDNWKNDCKNVISFCDQPQHVDETIKCLDWIFSKTAVGELDTSPSAQSMLHYTACQGHIKLLQYLMKRLPHLTLDEKTLLWACKHKKADLVAFIVAHSSDLPQSQAIQVAAAFGGLEVLGALGVGLAKNDSSGSGPEADNIAEGTSDKTEDIGKALAAAAAAAIENSNWKSLDCIVSDRRFEGLISNLLGVASSSADPERGIKILLASQLAARQAYSCRIPWQAQALATKENSHRLLQVLASCHIPPEIGGVVWAFLNPECEDSPAVRSGSNFWQTLRVPLERDLGVSITYGENNSYSISGIGQLSFRNGYCVIKNRFDVAGVRIDPNAPLRMSSELGGCFLATGDVKSALWLKRVVPVDNAFRYNELRLILRSFRRSHGTTKTVIDHAKKFNTIMVPASNIAAMSPGVRAGKIQSKTKFEHDQMTFSCTHFTDSKWVLITVPCLRSDNDPLRLLEENMTATKDETFFCIDSDGAACAALFELSHRVAHRRFVLKLIQKARG